MTKFACKDGKNIRRKKNEGIKETMQFKFEKTLKILLGDARMISLSMEDLMFVVFGGLLMSDYDLFLLFLHQSDITLFELGRSIAILV